MKLGELLREAEASETGWAGVASQREEGPIEEVDPLAILKNRAQARLFDRLGQLVLTELEEVIAEDPVPLTPEERHAIVCEIAEHVIGYGPIEPFLADPDVTEVMVNSDDSIFVERAGRIHLTEARFNTVEHLRQVIERIVSQVGRRIDESSPMVDARLPDGSRVNAVIPPLAVDGPMLTIRKFSRRMYGVGDLIENETLTAQAAEFLEATVVGRLNVLISGGTGTGKTTLLNVLSGFIPSSDRVVTIEDAVELRLRQRHVVRLESRPPNIEGKGQISIRDLVRNSLRMRPDRIVVGEVRGSEALDMLQAMNTGHEGSLSTLHANAPRDALSRLETMVLMAGMDLPIRAIREQIASAVDLIVHVSRLRDGTRRVTHIEEVIGMEGDRVTVASLYTFDYGAGVDDDGRFLGGVRPTGLRPMFADRLLQQGIELHPNMFEAAIDLRADGARR
jgi:pilus assembly protein CpaF